MYNKYYEHLVITVNKLNFLRHSLKDYVWFRDNQLSKVLLFIETINPKYRL